MVNVPLNETQNRVSNLRKGVRPEPSTIMVIDDESSIRMLLKAILESVGYRVLCAANGVEALKLLLTAPRPDLVLLDMMMPVMNGWDFLEVAKADERLREIPMVLMTAYSRSEIQLPEYELIRKPFDFAQLRKTVAKYCGPGDL